MLREYVFTHFSNIAVQRRVPSLLGDWGSDVTFEQGCCASQLLPPVQRPEADASALL